MEHKATFDMTKIKRVRELRDDQVVNKHLKQGWVLLDAGIVTGAYLDKVMAYFVGTTTEDDPEDDFYSEIVR